MYIYVACSCKDSCVSPPKRNPYQCVCNPLATGGIKCKHNVPSQKDYYCFKQPMFSGEQEEKMCFKNTVSLLGVYLVNIFQLKYQEMQLPLHSGRVR